jgi:molybdopterin-guanine dinucleotide biosynthesis protein A
VTQRRVTGLVLAGGRSSRFGRDKLAERLDGRTLLESAIEGVTPGSTEILVVAAPDAAPDLPAGARLVHDPVAFEGPLAGVAAGLRAARESIVLVVGGDMPTLVGAVIDSMLAALEVAGVQAAVLEHEGRARPLPIALRRDPALATADSLLADGERRLRALTKALETTIIPEATWRALDPYGMTVRDIDTPADLG